MSRPGVLAVAARRLAAAAALTGAAFAAHAQLESPKVKVMLDWTIQGTHAPFFVAERKGYFKQEGLEVSIDRGTGAGNTANAVASGTYDIGYVDQSVVVKHNALNPGKTLQSYYIAFDVTPMAFVSLRNKANIRTPQDLDGKRVAAPPNSANVVTLPILLKAANAESTKVNWQFVAPQLMAPMLMRGDADAIGGFVNSQVPAVLEMGNKMEDVTIMRYSDFGVDMYSLALASRKEWVDANPKTIAAFVRAFNKGYRDVIADPAYGIQVMKERDPLFNAPLETIRLDLALDLTVTPHVRANGMSTVVPARMQKTIDTVATSENLPTKPTIADVWTDRFLPPQAERMVSPKK
jgi:NitT/TauT family transport system substrate-binding protein